MTMVFIQTMASFIASCGFGIIFNIKGKKLFFAAIGGGLSWFVYALGLHLNLSTISSLFISSICFSIYSEIFARILKTPVTTLVICCLIPLVPGAGMYYTMYEAITGNVTRFFRTWIKYTSLIRHSSSWYYFCFYNYKVNK